MRQAEITNLSAATSLKENKERKRLKIDFVSQPARKEEVD